MARRANVQRNVSRRPDGKLALGYRDSNGKQRWPSHVPLNAARAECDVAARQVRQGRALQAEQAAFRRSGRASGGPAAPRPRC
jgi:hypothetical protein